MRYNDTCIPFWRSYLRGNSFHGGFRHEGQVRSCAADMGQFEPTEGLFNFAVPSKAVLSTEIVHRSPGIALTILDTVAESQSNN
jgi:hypothetical protein